MFGKKSTEIQRLNSRIEFLEFQLCRGEHDFIPIEKHETVSPSGQYIDFYTTTKFRCSRCGKTVEKTEIS